MDHPRMYLKRIRRRCKSSNMHLAKRENIVVYNYKDNKVMLPHCVDTINVSTKEKEVDVIPEYGGSMTLPDGSWSPGTWDTWYLLGHFGGLTAKVRVPRSLFLGIVVPQTEPQHSHSWACLGCSSKALYVTTVGFKAEALG